MGDTDVEKGDKKNFLIQFYQNAFKNKVVDDSWLWHKRFCYLNFHGLNLLKENPWCKALLIHILRLW